jgi:hypothetical protein
VRSARAGSLARAGAAALLAGSLAGGCGAAPAGVVVDLGAAPRASASAAVEAPAASGAAGDTDLSITFHPGFVSHLGWVALEAPVPLEHLGSPGAKTQRFDAGWARIDGDEIGLQVLEIELSRVDWASTSVLLDQGHLCSPLLRDAVARAHPPRLLLRIGDGLGAAAAACLARLPAPRLYLTGCIHHRHRPEERCDGDAEIQALAAEEGLRGRIGGLALSLASPEALERLGRFPVLSHLAIATGREPARGGGFSDLPFDALPALRYLDLTSWDHGQRVSGRPEELRFLAQLHTLRWHGVIADPVVPCQLRRLSAGHLSDAQLAAFAGCAQLVELSSDDAELGSAAALPGFARLERLHLRHLHTGELSALAGLQALRQLSLPAARTSAFAFVARLPELRTLDLSQSELADLSPLAQLTHLERLDLGFTQVSDLRPLGGLGALVALDLHNTPVVDLAPLAGLRRLQTLDVSGTAISDIGPLTAHPALQWVILHDSKVRDAGALLTMPALKRAHVGGLSLPPAQLGALTQRLGYALDSSR